MSVYSEVQGNQVGRSVFDLSHVKRFTCDMGQLVPVCFLECVPGDRMKIGMECVTRFQPLVAPILDSVSLTVHYFFVPTRLCFDNEADWNTFLTGGVDGKDESVSLPIFGFDYIYPTTPNHPFSNGHYIGKYSLWDYFGLPLKAKSTDSDDFYPQVRTSCNVNGLAQRCYNLVFNEFYRDENLMEPVQMVNNTVLYRSWKKDYFTSALPWQQRGIAPALPLSGTVPVQLSGGFDLSFPTFGNSAESERSNLVANNGNIGISKSSINGDLMWLHGLQASGTGTADLSNAATFDIATLRQCTQIQRWLELNARGGVRYTEFLRSHFGIAPTDEVLQRPEYIGGTKSDIVVSEVLQTSSTVQPSGDLKGSPQGNLAGHGLGATTDLICDYTCKEFGYIIGIASYMPKPSYQQGVPRMFSRKTRYDFYFPEFAHLSEQAVLKGEIFAEGTAADKEIFGYQGCYNEMRHMSSINCADMRDTFRYWHLGRIFSAAPSLNAGFLTTNSKYSGGIRKDIFASQDEPGLLVQYGNLIKAVRPLPVYGTPGFVDHVGRM